LREEIAGKLIPAVLPSSNDAIGVEVRWNIATLSGEVDRKSDADMLTRLARELDGVVGVVDQLTYRWDDIDTATIQGASLEHNLSSV
jgi:osmotically-inducible protein OsmY